jgi:hypothetical protein
LWHHALKVKRHAATAKQLRKLALRFGCGQLEGPCPREAQVEGGPVVTVGEQAEGYSAPTALKSWLTNTWCGQLSPMQWTLYSPLLSSATRSTMTPG